MSATDNSLHDEISTIYSDHHRWLFGWLRKKLGCSHHASDVVQDTFLRIISSRDALLGVREPRAFLTTTAKHLLVDQARRKLIEQTYLSELALCIDDMAGYPSSEEIVIAVQALEEISTALEAISAKARDAFLLHYLDDQSHAAISVHLGVSTRMVQKYLVQALVQCQKIGKSK